MTLLEKVLNTNVRMVILTDYEVKTNLLKTLSHEKVFKPMQFLSKHDLYEKVFFKYDQQALYLACKFMNLKPTIVEPLLQLLYTINPLQAYQSVMLKKLQSLYHHLNEKKALTFYEHHTQLFEDAQVLVAFNDIDDLTFAALKRLNAHTQYETLSPSETFETAVTYQTFTTLEEEIVNAAGNIRTLLETGTPLDKIGIVLCHEDYRPSLKAVFDMFNIPLSVKRKEPLSHYELVKTFLKHLDDTPYTHTHRALTHALKTSEFNHDNPLHLRIYTVLISTLNPFVKLSDDIIEILPFIKHTLEQKSLVLPETYQTMPLVDLHRIPANLDYLFVLGCMEGYFPKLKADDDYLSKEDMQRIHRDDAFLTNQRRKKSLIQSFHRVRKLHLSYAQSTLKEAGEASAWIDTLSEHFRVNHFSTYDMIKTPYSKAYEELYTKKKLDHYTLYQEMDESLSDLYATFEDSFQPFDNTYQKINEATLKHFIRQPLRLSYSTIQDYFKCRFKYLLVHLLKITEQEDTLPLALGSLFHDVLEHHIDTQHLTHQMIDESLQRIISQRSMPLEAKEHFFLKMSYDTIEQAFNTIKSQHTQSAYTPAAYEKRYEKHYDLKQPVIFSGIIDKIMTRETNEGLHMLLIDYKTGKPTLNLKESLYGLSAQLICYVLLVTSAYPEADMTGFYEQTLLPKTLKHQEGMTYEQLLKEHMKLNGYTIDSQEEAHQIDLKLDDDTFIKGMRLNKDGAFSYHAKIISKDDLMRCKDHMDDLIKEAANNILSARFDINPKKDQKGKDISCQYCEYKDVCFKRPQDYQTVDIPEDEATLFTRLAKRGDAK